MGTDIRPEITDNDPDHISKHKYYELKHFCLQYHDKRRRICQIDDILKNVNNRHSLDHINTNYNDYPSDKITDLIDEKLKNERDISLIKFAASDLNLCDYILKAVTEGRSYNNLTTMYGMNVSTYEYYKEYRHFFKTLSNSR